MIRWGIRRGTNSPGRKRWVFPQVFSLPRDPGRATGTEKDTLFLVVGYVTLRFFDDDVKAVLVNK